MYNRSRTNRLEKLDVCIRPYQEHDMTAINFNFSVNPTSIFYFLFHSFRFTNSIRRGLPYTRISRKKGYVANHYARTFFPPQATRCIRPQLRDCVGQPIIAHSDRGPIFSKPRYVMVGRAQFDSLAVLCARLVLTRPPLILLPRRQQPKQPAGLDTMQIWPAIFQPCVAGVY